MLAVAERERIPTLEQRQGVLGTEPADVIADGDRHDGLVPARALLLLPRCLVTADGLAAQLREAGLLGGGAAHAQLGEPGPFRHAVPGAAGGREPAPPDGRAECFTPDL